jgi:2-polyprenyl-3-methyl-5-hydroxy-6-metoxy-1,4-benzoquinol methylase
MLTANDRRWRLQILYMGAAQKDKYFYTTIADSFEALMNPYDVRRRLEIVFDELLTENLENQSVLDAGAGTGYFSERAKQRKAHVISVDLGVSLLRRVGARAGTTLAAGDITSLPFLANTFDVVISSEVIEHTGDPRRAVVELGRVLKPGGILVLTCPNQAWQWVVHLASRTGLRPFQGIEQFPSYDQLESFTSDAGLRLIAHFGFHPWPFQIRRLWPVSRWIDARMGRSLAGRKMINQAIKAVKPIFAHSTLLPDG